MWTKGRAECVQKERVANCKSNGGHRIRMILCQRENIRIGNRYICRIARQKGGEAVIFLSIQKYENVPLGLTLIIDIINQIRSRDKSCTFCTTYVFRGDGAFLSYHQPYVKREAITICWVCSCVTPPFEQVLRHFTSQSYYSVLLLFSLNTREWISRQNFFIQQSNSPVTRSQVFFILSILFHELSEQENCS